MGLRINTRSAEDLKKREGTLLIDEVDNKQKVWLRGDYSIGDREIPLRSIHKILKIRAEELFLVIKDELSDLIKEEAPRHIVLTGGGSQLRGALELASEFFGIPSEQGYPPNWVDESLRIPENSTAIGLMLHAAKHYPVVQQRSSGLIRKLKGMFTSQS